MPRRRKAAPRSSWAAPPERCCETIRVFPGRQHSRHFPPGDARPSKPVPLHLWVQSSLHTRKPVKNGREAARHEHRAWDCLHSASEATRGFTGGKLEESGGFNPYSGTDYTRSESPFPLLAVKSGGSLLGLPLNSSPPPSVQPFRLRVFALILTP